jgi:ABC-type lipoprotein release transport system permease subunit
LHRSSQLYGVKSTDAWTLASVVGLLLIIASIAALGPVRRASRVDLVGTLRSM